MKASNIFLVEDEALIRMMIAEMVEELGHRVVAEAGNVETGCELAQNASFDLALLDINLDGSSSAPVAEIIEKRGLPFLFVSGYGLAGLPQGLSREASAAKPSPSSATRLARSSLSRRVRRASETMRDRSHELCRREWLFQKNAVRHALRCPFISGSSGHLDNRKRRVCRPDLPCDVPAAQSPLQVNVGDERLVVLAAALEQRQRFLG
jgi:CheY-like chemotaxis protein